MPWTYNQATGVLSHDGVNVATGYSGILGGKNNPDMQNQGSIGPIPAGTYTINAPFHHPHAGNYTMRLTPQAGTNTFGRTGLMMHGDSIARPGQASTGCIIENLVARHQVWNSGDHVLNVVTK